MNGVYAEVKMGIRLFSVHVSFGAGVFQTWSVFKRLSTINKTFSLGPFGTSLARTKRQIVCARKKISGASVGT